MSAEDVLFDFFVKIRDACIEELGRIKPDKAEVVCEYNPESICWVRSEGRKGTYERYPAFQQRPSMSVDYVNLVNDLKSHDGKMVRGGLFYWLWDDEVTIGRKLHKMK